MRLPSHTLPCLFALLALSCSGERATAPEAESGQYLGPPDSLGMVGALGRRITPEEPELPGRPTVLPDPVMDDGMQIFGAWHAGNHYCDWALPRELGEFDAAKTTHPCSITPTRW